MGHRGEFELVTDDQRVLGTLREGSPWPGQMLLRSVTIDGRRFHMTPAKRRATTDLALVDDATGSVVLRVFGRHHAGEAKAEIQLASGTRLRFPMLGGGPKLAVMTAVDQTGKRLLRFRQGKRLSLQTRTAARIEVVVNPAVALITDLVLVIAVASGFILTEHRSKPGGGGG